MKFIGVRRDTLASANKGKHVEVTAGLIFDADPEHSEVKRALAVGSIQTYDDGNAKAAKKDRYRGSLLPHRSWLFP